MGSQSLHLVIKLAAVLLGKDKHKHRPDITNGMDVRNFAGQNTFIDIAMADHGTGRGHDHIFHNAYYAPHVVHVINMKYGVRGVSWSRVQKKMAKN